MSPSLEHLFAGVFSLNKLADKVAADLLASVLRARTTQNSSLHDDIKELSLRHSMTVSNLTSAARALEALVTSDEPDDVWNRQIEALGASPALTSLLSQNRTDSSRCCKVSSTDINQLISLSWNFGVTASSSELSRVGSTYLQLKLELQKPDGNLTSKHIYLSLPQFYEFLHELEKAKSSLEYSL